MVLTAVIATFAYLADIAVTVVTLVTDVIADLAGIVVTVITPTDHNMIVYLESLLRPVHQLFLILGDYSINHSLAKVLNLKQ